MVGVNADDNDAWGNWTAKHPPLPKAVSASYAQGPGDCSSMASGSTMGGLQPGREEEDTANDPYYGDDIASGEEDDSNDGKSP